MYTNKKMGFIALNFVVFFLSTISYGQANEITIRFIGNCGLSLTDGKSTVYVDFPYKSGAHHYMEYDQAEIAKVKEGAVLIYTHGHSDHYSKKLSKRVSKKIYGPWNVKDLEELNNSLEDFSIQPFQTDHRFSFNHYSYLITWHGRRIYISGDTEHSETIAKVTDLDWAFIPAWLLMDVLEKEIQVDTKMFGLYHIGPNDKIANNSPEKLLLFTETGQTVSIPY